MACVYQAVAPTSALCRRVGTLIGVTANTLRTWRQPRQSDRFLVMPHRAVSATLDVIPLLRAERRAAWEAEDAALAQALVDGADLLVAIEAYRNPAGHIRQTPRRPPGRPRKKPPAT